VLNEENNPVVDPCVTGGDGSYLFKELDPGLYSVGIVTPLGFAVSSSETFRAGWSTACYGAARLSFNIAES
jgi:hypothetical protein